MAGQFKRLPLIRPSDGYVWCSGCTASEKKPTYLPPALFANSEWNKARENNCDGMTRKPTILCIECKEDRNAKANISRQQGIWHRYECFGR